MNNKIENLQSKAINNKKTLQKKKLTLKNDIVFKTFFSRKGNEEYLIDFLNALLGIEIHKIHIKEEVNLEKLSQEEKGGKLDIQAELNDGIIACIEMQVTNNHNIEARTTFYSTKELAKETKRGTDYNELKQIIMINILDYEMLGFEEYISRSKIVLEEHPEYEILKGMKWIFIELPKFRKCNPDMNKKINQWLAVIDNSREELVKVAEQKNEVLKKAREEITYLTGDEEIQRLQELREKWEMDRISEIGYERRKALAEGEAKGRAEGEAKGRRDGERKAKKETVKKMLEQELPIELIIKITEMTEKEIEAIKNKG